MLDTLRAAMAAFRPKPRDEDRPYRSGYWRARMDTKFMRQGPHDGRRGKAKR